MLKQMIATLGLGVALAVASPNAAEAQGPIFTGGLVNVTLTNVANNNEIVKNVNIAVPVQAVLNLAANICGVPVTIPILAAAFVETGSFICTNEQTGRGVQITPQAQ